MDMLILTLVLDNKMSCAAAERSPATIEHLAQCVLSLVRHNNAIETARVEEFLDLPSMDEVRTVVREGRTFGVITGGKT